MIEHNGETFEFQCIQRERMGRPGIVKVKVLIGKGNPKTIKIAGNAVIVFKTTLNI